MRNLLRVGLVVITLYLLFAVAFSQRLHFSRALDEGYHLEYILFIKQHERLPISYEERAQITRADFPPLYHLLVSLLSAGVNVDGPPKFKFFGDSFRYRVIDYQDRLFETLETEDLQPPYLGEFLVWQIGRWISILLSMATLVIVFFTLRDIPPLSQKFWLPLCGAAMLAFIPRYLVLGSALNDDNLLGLLAALYFWMLVKVFNKPERRWPFILIGIVLGLSLTVKYTLILIPFEIAIICILIAIERGFGYKWALSRLTLTGFLTLLSSSWWFGWNLWFLNTVAQDGWLIGLVRPLLAGGTDQTLNRVSSIISGGQVGLAHLPENIRTGTFLEWVQNLFVSFWGFAIDEVPPGFPYVYVILGLILLLVVFGLWRLWRTGETQNRRWLILLIFHILIFLVLPLIRFGLTHRLSVAAQGRHILIPAATAVAGLLIWGLAAAIPPRWQRLVFTMVIIGLVGWTGAHFYRLNVSAALLLPLRTFPQAAEWLPQSIHAQFGDAIELTSYEIVPQPEQGLFQLNLAWRSLGYVNENYLLRIDLLDSQGQVMSHWLGYHGHGRVPTLAWDPGDSIFDRLVLPLPNLPAGNYQVQLELSGYSGPLMLNDTEDTILPLAQIELSQASTFSFPGQVDIGPTAVPFAIWQSDGPVEVNDRPIYRYPATISIIVDHPFKQTGLKLELIDAQGREWPATQQGDNIYHFVIAPDWQSGNYRLQFSHIAGDQLIGQTISEPLLTVENWWKRQFEAPEIAHRVEANFANQLKLLGYKLPQPQVKAGESFPITLYWQAPLHRSPQANFTQFNHLLDSSGVLRGGYDRLPLEYYSTLLWAPGEIVVDGYTVPVQADAPPGEYYLNVGYYLTVGESAVSLPLVIDGKITETSSVVIGPITVVAPQN